MTIDRANYVFETKIQLDVDGDYKNVCYKINLYY